MGDWRIVNTKPGKKVYRAFFAYWLPKTWGAFYAYPKKFRITSGFAETFKKMKKAHYIEAKPFDEIYDCRDGRKELEHVRDVIEPLRERGGGHLVFRSNLQPFFDEALEEGFNFSSEEKKVLTDIFEVREIREKAVQKAKKDVEREKRRIRNSIAVRDESRLFVVNVLEGIRLTAKHIGLKSWRHIALESPLNEEDFRTNLSKPFPQYISELKQAGRLPTDPANPTDQILLLAGRRIGENDQLVKKLIEFGCQSFND